jgi:hypothetical protein
MIYVQPPLVFVYDREMDGDTDSPETRVQACRDYANRLRWEIAGQWLEKGDSENRLIWRGMVAAMATHHHEGRSNVCLVATWDRISVEPRMRTDFRDDVQKAGGVCIAIPPHDL